MNHTERKCANTIVAIASSTGGPKALQTVLGGLPKDFPSPVVVVQHMPIGFTEVMAERLNNLCQMEVKEGEEGEYLMPGVIYIAKSGMHLTIKRTMAGKHILQYLDAPNREGVKPCANYLYESLAECRFDRHICVVLTGMGSDGTAGIMALKRKKECYVISQDQATSAIYGMPKKVYEAGLSDIVLPLNEISKEIIKMRG